MIRTLGPIFVLLAAPAAAQPAETSPLQGISVAEARTLSQDELIRRVFGQLAGQMRSVTRPYADRHNSAEPPFALMFATAPRSAGDHGQCLATVVHVGRLRPDRDLLLNDGAVATEIVYKVIGDVEPEGSWTEAIEAGQARLCAEAGPVIPADETGPQRPVFFSYSGVAPLPKPALIFLQRALRGAAAGSYADIACNAGAAEASPETCRNPRALLAGLRMADLTSLRLDRTGRRETEYRIEAVFLTTGGAHWQLTLGVDVSVHPAEMRRDIRLGHAELALIQTVDVADEPPPR
jgi:hypothetical protein